MEPMDRELMWVEKAPGAHLSQSRKKPGAYSPLTRDGDNNLSHVILSKPDPNEDLAGVADDVYGFDAGDEDDSDEEEASGAAEVVGALVVLGVTVGVAAAAPRVKRWWKDRRARSRTQPGIVGSEDLQPREVTASGERAAWPQPAASQPTQEVVSAPEDHRVIMSTAEAHERMIAALEARRFSEEQINLLRNARIQDERSSSEVEAATGATTPQQLGEGAPLILEGKRVTPEELALSQLERTRRQNQPLDARRPLERAHEHVAEHRPQQVSQQEPLQRQHEQSSWEQSQVSSPVMAAPGWYSDPWKVGTVRYWDGARWTHHVN